MKFWGMAKHEVIGTLLSCLLLLLTPVASASASQVVNARAEPRTDKPSPRQQLLPKAYGWAVKPAPAPMRKPAKKVAAAHTRLPPPKPPADCNLKKCLALTFDDGPAPTTPLLLDQLRSRNVHATFFVLGMYAERYPDITRRIIHEGHQIGNHTWDHHQLTTLAPADAKGEIDRTQDALTRLTGTPPAILRPPYGATNPAVAGVTTLPQILWSIDPYDWRDKNAQLIADRIVSAAAPGGIVLAHDVYASTVEAISQVIDRLRLQGYEFVTINELLGPNLPPGEYRHR